MSATISIDDPAPDFDLSSTEEALLCLRDEVPRTSVLLYFFTDADAETAHAELRTLQQRRAALARAEVKILGVSPAKMPRLTELQRELGLDFPLLRDDRDFSASYGVVAPEEGSTTALFLVDRAQRVRWAANPVSGVEAALAEVTAGLKKNGGSSTSNYPKSVINRLVDRWLN